MVAVGAQYATNCGGEEICRVSIASLNPSCGFFAGAGLYRPDCSSARPEAASLAAAFSARPITARLRRACGVLVDFIGFFIPLVPIPYVSEGAIDGLR